MYLHNDREVFEQLIAATSTKLSIEPTIVEKDYFVTITLGELNKKSELIVETYIGILPYPTEVRLVDNYIHQFLAEEGLDGIAEQYGLMPFKMKVQDVRRTLIDKVFAICDYYMDGKIEKHSRHIYDIHMILPMVVLDDEFKNLVNEVRNIRKNFASCPSAADGIDVNQLLDEIIKKECYKEDYQNITENILFETITYQIAVQGIISILNKNIF